MSSTNLFRNVIERVTESLNRPIATQRSTLQSSSASSKSSCISTTVPYTSADVIPQVQLQQHDQVAAFLHQPELNTESVSFVGSPSSSLFLTSLQNDSVSVNAVDNTSTTVSDAENYTTVCDVVDLPVRFCATAPSTLRGLSSRRVRGYRSYKHIMSSNSISIETGVS